MHVICKKVGKRFTTALFLFLLATSSSFAAEIGAKLSSFQIEEGDSTRLNVVVPNASDVKPLTPPKVKGLKIEFLGKGRSVSIMNGRRTSSTNLTYRVVGLQKGSYTIPGIPLAIDGQEEKTNSLKLIVISENTRAAGENFVGLKAGLELSAKEIYEGQDLIVRYYIYQANIEKIVDLSLAKQPEAKDQSAEMIKEDIEDSLVEINGNHFMKTHLMTYCVKPLKNGRITVGGASIAIRYLTDSISTFSIGAKQKYLTFPPARISVKKLPRKDRPKNFSGLIGNFKMKTSGELNSSLEALNEQKFELTISGKGNIQNDFLPYFENEVDGLKIIFSEGEKNISLGKESYEGNKKIICTVFAEEPGEYNLGSLCLNYFDLKEKKYQILKSDPCLITVNAAEEEITEEEIKKDKSASFSWLIVLLIILAVVILLVLLFYFEHRRHAEIFEEKEEKAEKEKKPQQFKNNSFLVKEFNNLKESMVSAFLGNDYTKFLNYAEQCCSFLDRHHQIWRQDFSADLNSLKDYLYSRRYAGATSISRVEAEKVYADILKFSKNLKS